MPSESYLPLLDLKAGAFDGDDYQPERDFDRLTSQLEMVRKVMSGHAPMTLTQIRVELAKLGCQAGESSISAQLRNLRKAKHGGHTVIREHVAKGLYTYQLQAGLD